MLFYFLQVHSDNCKDCINFQDKLKYNEIFMKQSEMIIRPNSTGSFLSETGFYPLGASAQVNEDANRPNCKNWLYKK